MFYPNFKDTIAASPYIFILGVAGDSGSGKNSITYGIQAIFGKDKEPKKYCFPYRTPGSATNCAQPDGKS